MKKLFNLVILGPLFLMGCSFSQDYKIPEEDMQESLDMFNKHCAVGSIDPFFENVIALAEGQVLDDAFEGHHLYGFGLKFNDARTERLTSYDQLEPGMHSVIACRGITKEDASKFKFPDLSHLKPHITFAYMESGIDFLPKGMEVQSFYIVSPDSKGVPQALSDLIIVSDGEPPIFGSHIQFDELYEFKTFPGSLSYDLDGGPLYVRIGSTNRLKSYGDLINHDNTYIIFDSTATIPSSDNRMSNDSKFCKNFGEGTMAYLTKDVVDIDIKKWKKIEKPYVCKAGGS